MQVKLLAARSADSRSKKNAKRDRAIHDAAARGERQKSIASRLKTTESVVSRVLSKPRP